ncbi:primosomal protein N' [Candidatus Saccharibacteria bacterium]|nr:primosomal protein N' [Candidatus Saccharibacteria bacterium]
MYYEVIPTTTFKKSPLFSDGLLTYSFDQNLAPGTIVSIPLGKKTALGIIYRKTTAPTDQNFIIKSINKIVHPIPLPNHLLKSLAWLSSYYLNPVAKTANLFLPLGIEKNRRKKSSASTFIPQSSNPIQDITSPIAATTTHYQIPLNPAQKQALTELHKIKTHTKLLHGITGSGKTNIYLELASQVFSSNQSVILLVPEISLTPQLVGRFQEHFGTQVISLHSKLTEAERHLIWQRIHEADQSTPFVVIGPRSALFSPLKNLGLIIIDEAHEPSFYQDTSPRYHALRLASFMAQTLKIDCLLGTATPRVEDYFLAQKNHAYVALSEKAKSITSQTKISLIDLKDRAFFTRNRYFSDALLQDIENNLKQHKQTLLFHNRRGSAPLTICEHCGYQVLCPNCLLPLTLHSDSYQLICHTCGHHEPVPSTCPVCHHGSLIHKGFGTKLLESELKKLFKSARIARFDADNATADSLTQNFKAVKNGDIDIIIGTQTIAKGLDLPLLNTVGIVQADANLNLPDYAAEERTFQLITQVIGRVGRGHNDINHVFLQTFQPEHPVILAAKSLDYAKFADYLLKKRQLSHLPPFFYLLRISIVKKTEDLAIKKIMSLHSTLKKFPDVYLSAPTPSFHEYTPSGYSWQIIVKAKKRDSLTHLIESLDQYPEIRFAIDPPSLI